MRIVLDIFKNNNISINFDKSNFNKSSVQYLGQYLDKDGTSPNLSALRNLYNIVPPRTYKHVMKIVGIIQWFRPFIVNIAQKLAPVTNLLKKKEERKQIN